MPDARIEALLLPAKTKSDESVVAADGKIFSDVFYRMTFARSGSAED